VTEGVIDCLSLILSGYSNSCAVFGLSGIRWDWFQAKQIVLALDNDRAGKTARERLKKEATSQGKEVFFLDLSVYRGCKDLNEAWRRYGPIQVTENTSQIKVNRS
jgi:DNA primase